MGGDLKNFFWIQSFYTDFIATIFKKIMLLNFFKINHAFFSAIFSSFLFDSFPSIYFFWYRFFFFFIYFISFSPFFIVFFSFSLRFFLSLLFCLFVFHSYVILRYAFCIISFVVSFIFSLFFFSNFFLFSAVLLLPISTFIYFYLFPF